MSGIEAAGLVLGAIPLMAKAFQIYADCVSTARRYRKYKFALEDLYQEVDSEYVTFLNTCEQLLDGIVDNNTQKTVLLENPGGDAWKDKALDDELRKRLARSYDRFMDTIEDMKSTVEEIKTLLKLGPDGEVQINRASKFKEELKRLKFSIHVEDYERPIARMKRYNGTLSKWTEQALSLEASRYTPAPSASKMPDFQGVQAYASHVFNVLSASLQPVSCGCATAHSINLRLECRDRQKSKSPSPFRVVVSYSPKRTLPEQVSWRYEALDVHPYVEPPKKDLPPPMLKAKKRVVFAIPDEEKIEDPILRITNLSKIESLCREIPLMRSRTVGDCVGFLEVKPMSHKIAVFPTSTFAKEPNDASLKPFHTIFSNENVGQARVWWSAKLRVAVVMASSLLQLYHTPWLDDEWSNQDIEILEGAEGEPYDQVFISKTCERGSQQCRALGSGKIPVTYGGMRSRALFALGILLIELCIGKPFEELSQQRAAAAALGSFSSNFMDQTLVEELVERCYQERGIRYGSAVQRCVWCSFDTRKADLEDVQFRQAVYDGVVAPLEEDLKNFGGTLT